MEPSLSPFPDPIGWEMLDRYLAGESTPDEAQVVRTYLANHPEAERLLRQGVRLAEIPSAGEPDVQELWTKVTARLVLPPAPRQKTKSVTVLHTVPHTAPHTAPRTVPRTVPHARWSFAAALAAITAVGIWMSAPSKSHDQPREYATKMAERTTVTLSDGTRIQLAPQSRVTVSPDFGRTTRTVTLSGEADFAVATAGGAPFVVQTEAVSTRVLGTVFNVRHYGEDTEVSVAVRSGRVLTRMASVSRVVSAGLVARISNAGATIDSLTTLGHYTDWAHGELVFRETPIAVFLSTVERWYGYRFVVTDSALMQGTVSLRLKVSDSAEMFAALKMLLDVETRFNGSSVTLVPQRRAGAPVPPRYQTDQFKPSMEMGR